MVRRVLGGAPVPPKCTIEQNVLNFGKAYHFLSYSLYETENDAIVVNKTEYTNESM